MLAFYKELLKNPKSVAASGPSTSWLSSVIASFIPRNSNGFIIDLGAGTGAITKALLQKGFSPDRLIMVEKSEFFAKNLKKRFPQMNVIWGDAEHLSTLLTPYCNKVDTIVSTLPLMVFPKDIIEKIVREIESVLKPGDHYIHMTYRLTNKFFENREKFEKIKSKYVVCNIPPARVDIYRIKEIH